MLSTKNTNLNIARERARIALRMLENAGKCWKDLVAS